MTGALNDEQTGFERAEDAADDRGKSQSKHTPGPFHIERLALEDELWIRGREGGYMTSIALLNAHWQERGVQEANALLIAAAPDLLEALQAAVAVEYQREDGRTSLWVADAEAALAKARGEA